MNIFSSQAGSIAIFDSEDGNVPLGVIIGDLKDEVGFKGILTGISVANESAVQVMQTLREYFYIYSFGEKISHLEVTGLALVSDCIDQINPLSIASSGLARVNDWYERNRVSTLNAPIAITLTPGLTFTGFLTGFKYGIVDPSISLGQFSLNFFYAPRIRQFGEAPIYSELTTIAIGSSTLITVT